MKTRILDRLRGAAILVGAWLPVWGILQELIFFALFGRCYLADPRHRFRYHASVLWQAISCVVLLERLMSRGGPS